MLIAESAGHDQDGIIHHEGRLRPAADHAAIGGVAESFVHNHLSFVQIGGSIVGVGDVDDSWQAPKGWAMQAVLRPEPMGHGCGVLGRDPMIFWIQGGGCVEQK